MLLVGEIVFIESIPVCRQEGVFIAVCQSHPWAFPFLQSLWIAQDSQHSPASPPQALQDPTLWVVRGSRNVLGSAYSREAERVPSLSISS